MEKTIKEITEAKRKAEVEIKKVLEGFMEENGVNDMKVEVSTSKRAAYSGILDGELSIVNIIQVDIDIHI